jgi:hypothetical protein
MIRPLVLAVLAVAAASGARAQHEHAAPTPGAAPDAVAETFVVTGLRIGEADPPPGSAVGRAGLRYADGGYVAVVYGRPYARGRQVWGGLVGYDGVWVAGAHRATEVVTTVPLVVGGARLDPGAYSLFVTPRADGPWTLHVNRRLGMHLADEYDSAEDAAVAEAAPTTPAVPVEGLTWAFADDGSALTLAWADRAVAFPVSRADP